MHRALEKVAFLPFGLMIDKWRWGVFSGKITPADYNKAWWDLRREYQGVAPPVARSEADFDPGAKYHIPANVPYARYFLACDSAIPVSSRAVPRSGLHRPAASLLDLQQQSGGRKSSNKMLEMGQSRPWPEALEALTGEKEMDATAMLDYFAPLKKWLDEQNKKNGAKEGW